MDSETMQCKVCQTSWPKSKSRECPICAHPSAARIRVWESQLQSKRIELDRLTVEVKTMERMIAEIR
jgi:ribosomal protein L37E